MGFNSGLKGLMHYCRTVNRGCRTDSDHCAKHITQITMNRAQSYLVLKRLKATEIQQSRLIEELSVHAATLVYYLSCPEKLNIH